MFPTTERESYLPLAIERGVNGAAVAAWDDIVEPLPGTERVAGVNEGDSTFRLFLSLRDNFLPILVNGLFA